MHPVAWFLWAAGTGSAAVLTTNPFYLVPLFSSAVAVHSAHRRAGREGDAFRIFVLIALVTIVTRTALVLFGSVTPDAVAAAALEGLRLATVLVVFGTFNSVNDPYRVLRLAPRRFHEPALAAALALSLAPRTIHAVATVREAQKLRGLPGGKLRSVTALALPVLETGLEEAMTLAESMDARGHGRGRRTRYRSDRWTTSGSIVALAGAVAFVGFLGASLAGAPSLIVSTFPLAWPQVSFVLVAAALVPALPLFVPPAREGEQ